jgi:hypothetical protein
MEKHYPASGVKTPVLYDQMIGGRFKDLYQHSAYKNTCAVRMSYALNRSGLKLGSANSNRQLETRVSAIASTPQICNDCIARMPTLAMLWT